MPRISLWKPKKDNDYYFGDNILKDYMMQGGTGVYVHKYIGPTDGGGVTAIDDILFLENRSRIYDDDIYEMRGVYQPSSSEFDLSQFGLMLANDTIFIMFHYTQMLDIMGRKLMAGDVLELPHLVDPDTLDEDAAVTHRFYAIEEASHASEGYGNNWWSHVWRVKAKQALDSPEFADIVPGDELADDDQGLGEPNNAVPDYKRSGTIIGPDGLPAGEVCCDKGGSTSEKEQEITDGIIAEAAEQVPWDPKQYDASNLWIYEDGDGGFHFYPWAGDGIPPNGLPLNGKGAEFPEDADNGDFYLRTDYDTPRLFRKDNTVWRLVEVDTRKIWTSYNKILDTFIDNTDVDTMTDGSTQNTRKALSQVVKAKPTPGKDY